MINNNNFPKSILKKENSIQDSPNALNEANKKAANKNKKIVSFAAKPTIHEFVEENMTEASIQANELDAIFARLNASDAKEQVVKPEIKNKKEEQESFYKTQNIALMFSHLEAEKNNKVPQKRYSYVSIPDKDKYDLKIEDILNEMEADVERAKRIAGKF